MNLKLYFFSLLLVICACYRKSDDNSLKYEVLKYRTGDCYTDASGEDIRNQRNRLRPKSDRSRQTFFGLDFGKGYSDDFPKQSSEEAEYHPNPFLYVGDRNVGYGGAYGDTLDGYIPQDLRNARKKNSGSYQQRYKYARQGSLRSFNTQNTDSECVSQCVFNNMDIMEEDGTPSESAFLKWAQDKIKNERRRLTALKDIRKCFHSISNGEKEDGCEYARYLSECLKLDLDEEQ